MSLRLPAEYLEKLAPDWLVDYVSSKLSLSGDAARIGLYTVEAASAAYVLWRVLRPSQYKMPPGPRPLPILGNLHQMVDNCMYKTFGKLTKDFGDMATFYMGPMRMVILTSPDLVREVFLRQGSKASNRPYMRTMMEFSGDGADIIVGNLSPRLTMQRKLAHAALRKFSTGESLESYLESAFECLVDHVETAGHLEPYECSFLLAYNILASMAFGTKFKFQDPFLQNIMALMKKAEESFGEFDLTEFYPKLRFIPTKTSKVMKEFMEEFKGYIEKAWRDHMKSYDPDKLTDFTYHLIHEMKEAEAHPEDHKAMKLLTEDNLLFTVFDLFSAGTDTTRMTLMWIWSYLAAFPELQKRAQDEVDQVLGRDGKVTVNSREQLPFVDAFLHEVMRIRTVAATGVFHETSEDIKAGGYDIPKGTTVVSNTWSIHMDPKNWKDPEAFIPERWLDENGKYFFQQNGFLPFSVGKRSCVGEGFAKQELHMLTTMMLQRFTIEPQPGYQVGLENVGRDFVKPPHHKLVVKPRN